MKPRGFALLITITLVAFLVLILVTLATLTRVETQIASNSQQQAQARQNALTALNIALGQLQKHTGPDQRVTARADVRPPPGHSWASVPVNPTATNYASARTTDAGSIDAYWRAARNRQWTGTWLNTRADPADYDATDPAAFNPDPALQSWLVSGNETIPDTFKPHTIITGLTPSSTPLDEILDADGKPHRLLVKSSARVTDAASLDRAVTAPQIEIRASSVPGTDGTSTPVGHYAWWVGDEGVKVRANLIDGYTTVGTPEANRTRLQSAQRPAIEAMTTNGTNGLAPLDPARQPDADALAQFNTNLLNTFTPAQLALVSPAATLPVELKTRFHDLSVSSRGVLADAKNGGLKRDLSYLFAQSSVADFQTALHAAYGTTAIAPSASSNRMLTPTSTPYATLPPNAITNHPFDDSDPARPGMLAYAATWEQLWSFYNQGNLVSTSPSGAFTSQTVAEPRRHTETQHGVHPMVVQSKLYYRLRIEDAELDADGVNRTGTIWVDIIPVVLLANPYNVDLGPADYSLRFDGSRPRLRYGTSATPDVNNFNKRIDHASLTFPLTPQASTAEANLNLANASTGYVELVLRSTGIPAGEAHIFTIDPDQSSISDERIQIHNDVNDTGKVYLKNELDPGPALTFNTGRSIPADKTHVGLVVYEPELYTSLYLDYDQSEGDRRLIHYLRARKSYTGENPVWFFLVDPLSEGIRQGGGYNAVVNQPATVGAPTSRVPMQAVFYQNNYRAAKATYTGWTGSNHPVEWATNFAKNGGTGGPGTSPNPWIFSNLLRPPGSTTSARWGVVNIGEGQGQTVPPASIGGSGAGDVGFKNFLYDLPRPGRPVTSLGQLQHFNTTGFIPVINSGLPIYEYPLSVHSWQVNYALANSYAHPRVPRDGVIFGAMSPVYAAGSGYHYDGSYLWNDLLWDRFYFSSYPQDENFDFADEATHKLVNARYKPFRDRALVPWDEETHFRGDGDPANAANSRIAAQNLLVEGAFNINSTSVEAWKAVFASLKNVPVGTETSPSAPFARTLFPDGGSADAKTGTSPNSWTGFLDLGSDQIQSLAEEMVMQIRKRGPFLSLSEFVNRRLIPGREGTSVTGDPLGLGLSGALQSTIDRVLNQRNDVAAAFRATSSTTMNLNSMYDRDYIMPTSMSGFPGYLLQADILSALGPTLAARSDTFTIRTYGDTVNPATGDVTARAWCEAVVQRTPDYVVPKNASGGNDPHEDATDPTNADFGRRFQIVSFRWLSPDDI